MRWPSNDRTRGAGQNASWCQQAGQLQALSPRRTQAAACVPQASVPTPGPPVLLGAAMYTMTFGPSAPMYTALGGSGLVAQIAPPLAVGRQPKPPQQKWAAHSMPWVRQGLQALVRARSAGVVGSPGCIASSRQAAAPSPSPPSTPGGTASSRQQARTCGASTGSLSRACTRYARGATRLACPILRSDSPWGRRGRGRRPAAQWARGWDRAVTPSNSHR